MRGTVDQGAAGGGGFAGGGFAGGGFAGMGGGSGGGYGGGYGKQFVDEGNVQFSQYDSKDQTEYDVALVDAPLGAPLAKNVTQTYGVDKATFVLQSASDDTMQCVHHPVSFGRYS